MTGAKCPDHRHNGSEVPGWRCVSDGSPRCRDHARKRVSAAGVPVANPSTDPGNGAGGTSRPEGWGESLPFLSLSELASRHKEVGTPRVLSCGCGFRPSHRPCAAILKPYSRPPPRTAPSSRFPHRVFGWIPGASPEYDRIAVPNAHGSRRHQSSAARQCDGAPPMLPVSRWNPRRPGSSVSRQRG